VPEFFQAWLIIHAKSIPYELKYGRTTTMLIANITFTGHQLACYADAGASIRLSHLGPCGCHTAMYYVEGREIWSRNFQCQIPAKLCIIIFELGGGLA